MVCPAGAGEKQHGHRQRRQDHHHQHGKGISPGQAVEHRHGQGPIAEAQTEMVIAGPCTRPNP